MKEQPEKPLQELTKAEEEIMQILWKMSQGFVNDLLEHFPDPKPAYNTVSTIIRILEKKGFVGHRAYGKTYQYYPLVTKNDYTRQYMGNFMKGYFDNSYRKMVSFFTGDDTISVKEMEEIRRIIDQQIEQKKNQEK